MNCIRFARLNAWACMMVVAVSLASCTKQDAPSAPAGIYADTPQAIPLSGGAIPEVSGIADSKAHPGFLWVVQDSGNPPMIYLLRHDGFVADSLLIDGATNRDWEDMTLGKGPVDGLTYVYIADIGDNNGNYASCAIYRFIEPAETGGQVSAWDKITFQYSDGPRDAEALLSDPATGDIYIITKREARSRIYRLPFPQDISGVAEAEFVDELPYTGVTSAAVSPDDKAIIVKTYTQLYHYSKTVQETIAQALKKSPSMLGYRIEVQGEAVSFGIDNPGFFTLSEEALGIVPTLNFYRKN